MFDRLCYIDFVKNLLKKIFFPYRKTVRRSRSLRRDVSVLQIEKMGRMGQQLIVASR